MTPLHRQSIPGFWTAKEQLWLDKLRSGGSKGVDSLRWKHESKSLAQWFHESVRAPGERRLCAYCDGELGSTSRETIDHFIPEHAHAELALNWDNLYPACDTCNSTFKGKSWSCLLIRPDIDPVDVWIMFDSISGRLRPKPGVEKLIKKKILISIKVFGLNDAHRCEARLRVLDYLREVLKAPSNNKLALQMLNRGPYRFVTRQYMQALKIIT